MRDDKIFGEAESGVSAGRTLAWSTCSNYLILIFKVDGVGSQSCSGLPGQYQTGGATEGTKAKAGARPAF